MKVNLLNLLAKIELNKLLKPMRRLLEFIIFSDKARHWVENNGIGEENKWDENALTVIRLVLEGLGRKYDVSEMDRTPHGYCMIGFAACQEKPEATFKLIHRSLDQYNLTLERPFSDKQIKKAAKHTYRKYGLE